MAVIRNKDLPRVTVATAGDTLTLDGATTRSILVSDFASTMPVLGLGGTSATSLVIANGVTRVFATQVNLAYNGARVRATSNANHANWMEGVASYSGAILTMTVDAIGGSGTFADWVFAIAGSPGNMSGSNNLSELTNFATARSNIGLGSMATQSAGAVAITGGSVTGLGAPTATADAATKGYVDYRQPTPGGRLTVVPGQPAGATASNATALYYAPYNSPYVPIYDGTSIKYYNFTSGPTDQFGLTFTPGNIGMWQFNTVHDVFVTLVAGVPTLCTLAWTTQISRYLSMTTTGALFNGLLTNFTSVTMKRSNNVDIVIPANQATYLGTILIDATSNDKITHVLGGAASGGVQGRLAVWNNYNQIMTVGATLDSGARYGYAGLAWRVPRGGVSANSGMQIVFVRGFSREPVDIYAFDDVATSAILGSSAGLGIGIDAYNAPSLSPVGSVVSPTANVFSSDFDVLVSTSGIAVGSHFVAMLQQADNTANVIQFNNVQQCMLQLKIPM